MVAQLKEKYDVDVTWEPFLLRPDTPPEGRPIPDYVRARYRETTNLLVNRAQSYGLNMVFRDWVPDSRVALAATEFARENGRLDEFHKAVFHRYYGEGQDLSDWAVLRDAAEEAGLDGEAMQTAVEGSEYPGRLNAKIKRAYEIGVNSVPTYVINDRYAVVGAQPFEVFKRVLDQLEIFSRDSSEPL